MKARTRILATMALIAISSGRVGGAESYVGRLKSMRGESYAKVSCTGYICHAKRHATISAKGMLTSDAFVRIEKSEVQAGDIVDFGGVHVAVYVGQDSGWFDSTPRKGVGPMQATAGDPWYSGVPVYLRWK
jgi:hypothetical protein